MRRSTIVVAVLVLLIAIAFFLHRRPAEQKPRHGTTPAPVLETAPASASAAPAVSAAPSSVSGRPPSDAVVPSVAPRPLPGTVRGVVKLKGPVPPRKMLKTTAEPECEAIHGPRIPSDEMVVDPSGNVQWAFVYVNSGLTEPPPPAPATPVYLDQVACVFTPHMLGMRVGQPLVVVSSDEFLHNVHALPFTNKEFNVALHPGGERQVKKTFDKPEVMFKVKCDIHPWMAAWIGVVDHPYFSITNAVGSYRIPELPPGRYTIEVWHEKCARASFLVEVPSGGEATLDFWLDLKTD